MKLFISGHIIVQWYSSSTLNLKYIETKQHWKHSLCLKQMSQKYDKNKPNVSVMQHNVGKIPRCLSAQHAVLKSKSKDWLAQNQDISNQLV